MDTGVKKNQRYSTKISALIHFILQQAALDRPVPDRYSPGRFQADMFDQLAVAAEE